jgi:hypothetical protein
MKRVLTAVLTFVVLLTAAPAYADNPVPVRPAGEDNGKWVGPIAFFIFVAVVGGMLFIANAYRKNNNNDQR